MIFGPSFFDENPMESIKTIFNWMLDNLTITFSFILVKAQNLFNDLIRYFTNWDIPNVENPKVDKHIVPTEKPVKPSDPETFTNYRKRWESSIPPHANIDDKKGINWTYFIIGTIIVGVVIGGTYYSWDTVSTIVPATGHAIWNNIKVVKNFIWRSRDDDGTGATQIFRPGKHSPNVSDDGEIGLGDTRSSKGKEVDRSGGDAEKTNRSMSQEDLAAINPQNQFERTDDSTKDTSESSDSSTSTDNSSKWLSIEGLRKYFKPVTDTNSETTSPSDTNNVQTSTDEVEELFDATDELGLADLEANISESTPTEINQETPWTPNPRDIRRLDNNEIITDKSITGYNVDPDLDNINYNRYLFYQRIYFEDPNNLGHLYRVDEDNGRVLLTAIPDSEIPEGLRRCKNFWILHPGITNVRIETPTINTLELSDTSSIWDNPTPTGSPENTPTGSPESTPTGTPENTPKNTINPLPEDSSSQNDSSRMHEKTIPQFLGARILRDGEFISHDVKNWDVRNYHRKMFLNKILVRFNDGEEIFFHSSSNGLYLQFRDDKFHVIDRRDPLFKNIRDSV